MLLYRIAIVLPFRRIPFGLKLQLAAMLLNILLIGMILHSGYRVREDMEEIQKVIDQSCLGSQVHFAAHLQPHQRLIPTSPSQ